MKKSVIGLAAMLLLTVSCARDVEKGNVRTHALPDEAWGIAEWLSVADAPVVTGRVTDGENNCSAPGASWFMTSLDNEKRVTKACWMTTSLGVFELYVNGKPVGEEVLRPGFTHPLKTRRTFTYDITRLLKRGKGETNVLSAQVTPGWWGDKIITPSGSNGMWGTKCAFRAVLEVTYSDGSVRRFGTNPADWKSGIAGPVKHAGIFEGERFDARQPMGFDTPEALSVPEINREFKGELLPSQGAEIYHRHDLALPVVHAYVWNRVEGTTNDAYGKVVVNREYDAKAIMTLHKGETLVVDFGQNAAAVPSFVFKADEGTVMTCLPGELLNDGNGAKSRGMDGPEGTVHRLNLRTADKHMRLEYTFGPGGNYVEYTPRSTFFGYRYISLTATGDVTIRSLSSVPVSSISQTMETGTFVTGNKDINQLVSNTIWGMRSNYLSVPTDCPQRNERQGWTADTQVFSGTGTFFADTRQFFHKWMRDMRDTQSPQGGFPGVAPIGQYGDAGMMRLGWADAGIIVPWTIWKQFDDREIVDENWEAMDRFMNHINETHYDHTTLSGENGNYQWADWLSYEPLESCGGGAFDGGPRPEAIVYWSYLSACYWLIDAQSMYDMAKATGRDAQRYRRMVEDARVYLREHFLTPEGTFTTPILNTMQTPALFALRCGLVSGKAREDMIARLRQNFNEHGGCLQTGFLGTSILMSTLTNNNMQDVAYELLFQRKNPSWLYSIDNGATTMWERWNSYMADKGMGPQGMNSFNHYAYGCVCQWLWESAAGIASDPASPGFRHIIMRPIPDKRLGFVKAEYPSASGVIKSYWRFDGDQWTWEFEIPQGATASVTLPGETQAKTYGSGKHKMKKTLTD